MPKRRLGRWSWEVIPLRKPLPAGEVMYVLENLQFQVEQRYTGVELTKKVTFRISPDQFTETWRIDYNDVGMWVALVRDEYDTPQEAARGLEAYLAMKDNTQWSKSAAPQVKPQVTIYLTGPMGQIQKVEGFLTSVEERAVNFIPKRGRRERTIMTYYSSFIMVVPGWNKPDVDSGFDPLESTNPNVSVSRGRYRSTDPRWVTDFLEGPGKGLRPIVLYENGHLVEDNSGLPRVATLHDKVLRFASALPKGSNERRALLEMLAGDTPPQHYTDDGEG